MKLVLSHNQEKSVQGKWNLQNVERSERLKNGLKKFLFFFVLGVFSILIPVLHFVLVPLFVVLSVVMGYQGYKMKHRIVTLDCLCANCGKLLKESYLVSSELRFRCENCDGLFFVSEDK